MTRDDFLTDVELTKEEFAELSPVARDQIAPYTYTDITTGRHVLCSDDAKVIHGAAVPVYGDS